MDESSSTIVEASPSQNNGMAVEQKESTTVNYAAKLEELCSWLFPQYGPVQFEQIPVQQNGHWGGPSKKAYKCQVSLFGMPIMMHEPQEDWETAKEMTAQKALQILDEFTRSIQGRQEDTMFARIFKPLVQEMRSYRPQMTKLELEEEAKVQAGAQRVLNIENLDASPSVRGQTLGPVLDAICTKAANFDIQVAEPVLSVEPRPEGCSISLPASSAPKAPPQSISNPTQTLPLENPISLLYNHYQKNSNKVQAPLIEAFQGKSVLWGARGTYSGIEVLVKAVYKMKSDARYEAARRIFVELTGVQDTFEPKKPDIDEDPEAKDFVIAHSTSLLTDPGLTKPTTVAVHVDDQKRKADERFDIINRLPSGPLKIDPLERKFVTIVNEYCQAVKMACPDYKQVSVNQSLTIAHVCHVPHFDGKEFISFAFTKARDAKEDVAARIFKYLQEKGLKFDNAGKWVDAYRSSSMLPNKRYRDRPHDTHGFPPSSAPFPFLPPHMMMGMPPFISPPFPLSQSPPYAGHSSDSMAHSPLSNYQPENHNKCEYSQGRSSRDQSPSPCPPPSSMPYPMWPMMPLFPGMPPMMPSFNQPLHIRPADLDRGSVRREDEGRGDFRRPHLSDSRDPRRRENYSRPRFAKHSG